MIRFCDKEVVCISEGELDRQELIAYFVNGNEDIVIVLDRNGQYKGMLTYYGVLTHYDINVALDTNYVILNEQIWENGRKFFQQYESNLGEVPVLPVLDGNKQLLCFAYEDEESNREIRMLRELEENEMAIGFHEIYSEYNCVTIEGCNELAYYFAKYLEKRDISVNVSGELWEELGEWNSYTTLDYNYLHIYAEGTNPVYKNFKDRQLHSVSAEFECIDKIYEANLNKSVIKDTKGDWELLLGKLREAEEIVILGNDVEAQDVYDLLLANGVECCCFTSEEKSDWERRLFGKEITSVKNVWKSFKYPIFIECCGKHSTWGLNGCDTYDYYGFKRNAQFFVIRDYIEIPKNSLCHVLDGKDILLLGDVYLCHCLYRYLKERDNVKVGYMDILGEEPVHSFKMPQWDKRDLTEESLCLVVMPEKIVKQEKNYELYEKMRTQGLANYTAYFSCEESFLYLKSKGDKYNIKELLPKGIVLGAITPFSGNVLIRDVLGGHPNICFMCAKGNYTLLNNNLYIYCIRLSEVKASEISQLFWKLYEEEAGNESIENDFPDKEKFQKEMERLLELKESFTSQELFVIFHIAYAKSMDKEVADVSSLVIYWEPHNRGQKYVSDMAIWLESEKIHGCTIRLSRNRYIAFGSGLRNHEFHQWSVVPMFLNSLHSDIDQYEKYSYECDNWEVLDIRFEDLKSMLKETYEEICKKLQIFWSENLLQTINLEKHFYFANILDLKPVYNNYEEYLSGYDRMRISLIRRQYQKEFGYPWIDSSNFTRKELQNMFEKKFRFEEKALNSYNEKMKYIYYMERQRLMRDALWNLRQQERLELLE